MNRFIVLTVILALAICIHEIPMSRRPKTGI